MLTYLKMMCETFLKDEEGASAMEYGLILGLISIVAIAVFIVLGGDLGTLLGVVETEVSGAAAGASAN